MSHTPTRSAVQEQAAQLLEIKNALRDKKRTHLEELFEQQQRIRQEMHELQSELHALDDEIDNLEQQSLITDGVLTQKTPPAPSTQWNAQEMFLTDPITQTVAKKCPPNVSESTIQEDYNVEDESPILDSTKPTVLQLGQPSLVVKQLKKPISRRGEKLESYFNQATTFNKPQVPKSYPWTERVLCLLRNTFKITSFREHQRDIIDATLSGKDCFVIMRTGGGKSLTYQLPALYEGRYAPEEITPKITIVISPLVSLIHDQEEQMNEFCPGSAISFTSNLKGGVSEHARRWELVRTPGSGVCLVFVTPEKVAKSGKVKAELEKLFKAQRLGRIVIDECHCCSQWGHDFRPDYTKLGMLKSHFPNVPLLAVTATASDQVRDDCCQLLQIRSDHAVFKSTANRPNLIYEVRIKSDNKNSVVEDMANFIKQKHPNSAGIVYTLSKKEAAETAKNLTSLGIKAEAYHADISPATKERVHRRWMKNEIQCVTATIAFGLGINKPDVRFVLHHSISKTLENYYQESGRAGRDGLSADCILYYAPKDVTRMRCMIDTDSRGTLDSFWQMVRYANDFGTDARCRTILLRALGEVNTIGLPPRPHDDQGQEKDVTEHAKMAIRLIQWSLDKGDKLTVKQVGLIMWQFWFFYTIFFISVLLQLVQYSWWICGSPSPRLNGKSNLSLSATHKHHLNVDLFVCLG